MILFQSTTLAVTKGKSSDNEIDVSERLVSVL